MNTNTTIDSKDIVVMSQNTINNNENGDEDCSPCHHQQQQQQSHSSSTFTESHETDAMDDSIHIPICIPTQLIVVPSDNGKFHPLREGSSTTITADSNNDIVVPQQRHVEQEGDGSSIDNPISSTTTANNSNIVTIRINEREEQLLHLLQRVIDQYNSNTQKNMNTTNTASYTTSNTDTNNSSINIDIGSIRNKDDEKEQLLVVRIAGGWVRDKVLGYPYDTNTNDIDIAINILTGVQFATLIQSYLSSLQQQQVKEDSNTYNNKDQQQQDKPQTSVLIPPNLHKMGIIAANPEQSKHLETACMRIYNIDIDFTNLRCHEIYSDSNNRIPDMTIQFGTPYSDAYRRDFTMNTLYYNISTYQIEDYTKRGINDLYSKVLVTPLDPFITFYDDPLRILRAIRFHIRFETTMDTTIIHAAQDHKIQTTLMQKVSRERVGKELEGMLSGKCCNPIKALQTIYNLHLSMCIFTLPILHIHCNTIYGTFHNKTYQFTTHNDAMNESTNESISSNDNCHANCNTKYKESIFNQWEESYTLLSILQPTWEAHITMIQQDNNHHNYIKKNSQIDIRLLPLITYIVPFRKLFYTEISKNNTMKEYNVISFIIKESLKFKNSDINAIMTIINNLDRMIQYIIKYYSNNDHSDSVNNNDQLQYSIEQQQQQQRLEIGLIVRDTKELWVTLLLLAIVILQQRQQQQQNAISCNDGTMTTKDATINYIQIGHTVYDDIIYKYDFDHCWDTIRPIMNGQELIKELQLSPGPTIGMYMEEQMKYILLFPKITKDECLQYLKTITIPSSSLSCDIPMSKDNNNNTNKSKKKKKTKM